MNTVVSLYGWRCWGSEKLSSRFPKDIQNLLVLMHFIAFHKILKVLYNGRNLQEQILKNLFKSQSKRSREGSEQFLQKPSKLRLSTNPNTFLETNTEIWKIAMKGNSLNQFFRRGKKDSLPALNSRKSWLLIIL